jgi:hypothetical protein
MKSCMHKIWEWTRTYPIWSINGHNSGKNQPTIFGMMGGHDVRMRILYQFHVWLIFARVMALYAENWVHILCTQLVIYLWHILFIFGMTWACTYYTDFTVGWFLPELWPFMLQIGYVLVHSHILCMQLFIHLWMDFITLAKINQTWNWYSMRILTSCPPIIPNMIKICKKINE